MTHDIYADLMNREIDGANTEAESRQLHEHMESHPEARERFERLNETPQVDPPSHLFHRIIEAIPFGRQAAEPARGFGAWISTILPTPRLRYVSTFALGIVAGFALLFVTLTGDRDGGSLDINQLYGTMKVIDPADGFQIVGSQAVDLDHIRGEIRLHESHRTLLADVSLHATNPIRWTLSYDQTDVAFEGFRQVEGGGEVVSASTGFSVDQAGDGRFILFFSEKDDELAPITLSIYEAGKLLYSKELLGQAGE